MRRLTEIINEMSAIRNRTNDKLRNDISKIQDEIIKNIDDDKKRIITAAGLKFDTKNKELYDVAFEILDTILNASKPYGAFLYMMYCIYESISTSKSPNAHNVAQEVLKVYDSKAIDEIVSRDSKCKEAKEKLEDAIRKADEEAGDTKTKYDGVVEELKELVDRYPGLNDLRGDIFYNFSFFEGKRMNDKNFLKELTKKYNKAIKEYQKIHKR
jgi:cytochrome c556